MIFLLLLVFDTAEPVRKVETGYAIVDDLESHATPGHPMRNERDVGNWVHELTHQVNCELRNKRGGNCFYVLDNKYLWLPEPAVTLRQVITERSDIFDADAIREWNNRPLYILDETTACTNGYLQDPERKWGALKCVEHSKALVRAIEKHDPGYSHLQVLKEYVEWNENRVLGKKQKKQKWSWK